jgi:hypothetical protein
MKLLFVIILLLIGIFLFSYLASPSSNREGLETMQCSPTTIPTTGPIVYIPPPTTAPTASYIDTTTSTMNGLVNAISGYQSANQPPGSSIPTFSPTTMGSTTSPTGLNLNPNTVQNLGAKIGSIMSDFSMGMKKASTGGSGYGSGYGSGSFSGGTVNTNTSSSPSTSFDNYNHYTGNAVTTMYYSADGTTTQVIENNGSFIIIVTLTNGSSNIYLPEKNSRGETTYYNKSGGSANLINTPNGLAVIIVDNDGTTKLYTSTIQTTQNTNIINKVDYGTVTDMNETAPTTTPPPAAVPTDAPDSTPTPRPTSGTDTTATNTPAVTTPAVTTPGTTPTTGANVTATTTSPPGVTTGPYSAVTATPAAYPSSIPTNTIGPTTNPSYTPYPSFYPPLGDQDRYMLKTQFVPPLYPVGSHYENYGPEGEGRAGSCEKKKEYPPCPPCARCPEPSFECKKVPKYDAMDDSQKPMPVLNNFASFGL